MSFVAPYRTKSKETKRNETKERNENTMSMRKTFLTFYQFWWASITFRGGINGTIGVLDQLSRIFLYF